MPSPVTVFSKVSSLRVRVAMAPLSRPKHTPGGVTTGTPIPPPVFVSWSAAEGLQHLDPVAVRIAHVEAPVAVERLLLAPVDLAADRADRVGGGLEVVDDERRMGLAGRHERLLDPDVQLRGDGAVLAVRTEPGAAAALEVGGLLDLGQPEPVDVEAAGASSPPGGQATWTWWSRDRHGALVPGETCATTKTRRNGSTTRPSRSG